MKSFCLSLLFLLSGLPLYAFAIWPVELTPENCSTRGFSFKITSEKNRNDLKDVTIIFYKVTPHIQAHSGASVEFRTEKDIKIAGCHIQSFEEQYTKSRDSILLYKNRFKSETSSPLFIYSFTISSSLLKNSVFWIYEESDFNNNEKYWFRLVPFIKAQQDAAANP